MRQRFYNAMSETIKEDKDGTFKNIVPTHDREEDGGVAQAILDDLKDFKTKELL